MKKTKLMRAALLLLVLTLITSCFVGGTFAKYTTSASGSDTARVANWGFKPTTIKLGDLFKTTYDNVLGADDVIAPGTGNSVQFGFTYGGATTAPEVAYTFEVSATESTCDPSIKDNDNIQWRLDNGDWGNWDKLIADIEALDGNKTGNKYAPGQLPKAFETAGDNMHTVAWQWAFQTTDTDGVVNAAQDVIDTRMGNADNLAAVTLKITVTATQID